LAATACIAQPVFDKCPLRGLSRDLGDRCKSSGAILPEQVRRPRENAPKAAMNRRTSKNAIHRRFEVLIPDGWRQRPASRKWCLAIARCEGWAGISAIAANTPARFFLNESVGLERTL
jgi:hypothetical protein